MNIGSSQSSHTSVSELFPRCYKRSYCYGACGVSRPVLGQGSLRDLWGHRLDTHTEQHRKQEPRPAGSNRVVFGFFSWPGEGTCHMYPPLIWPISKMLELLDSVIIMLEPLQDIESECIHSPYRFTRPISNTSGSYCPKTDHPLLKNARRIFNHQVIAVNRAS